MRFGTAWVMPTLFGFVLSATGCQPSSQPPSENQPGASQTTQHAHDHTQGGPHGGHLILLAAEGTQAGKEYHAEWLHDDESGQITVFLLDAEAQGDVMIPAETIGVEVVIGDNTRQHLLAAVRDEPGEATPVSQFQLADKSLVEALKAAGQGVEATFLVEIEGTSYRGHVEHEEHGAHAGHQH